MSTIAIVGPAGADSYLAAMQYAPAAELLHFNRITDALKAFAEGRADFALIPVYNTREGEVKEYFRLVSQMESAYWVDNVVLPIHLSFGVLAPGETETNISNIIGRSSVLRQCEEYIENNYPTAILTAVQDIESCMRTVIAEKKCDCAFIDTEELILKHGFTLLDREVVSHNRTRFAVIGKKPSAVTGYDATAVITRPLADRVGLLADTLGEFTRRGINILDLHSENDIKTQKLRIYIEIEGHIENPVVTDALQNIEDKVIQEEKALKVLGSFPRVDMRVKNINSFGFIGSGAMSGWFADRLQSEGYKTILTGRSSLIRPEEMITQVDVVVVCVPISVTAKTIRHYGPLLHDGQALIVLAGESENTLAAAIEVTRPGVEIMFVHNLWGPKAITMKDKNASIVRTQRSGAYCSEFEAFLYKHGAEIYIDSANQHDLLMGVGQKLPTTISVALAMTLREHQIDCRDIDSHSTLTSLYGIIAMARTHNQNPRTYAEIMATSGDGRKIVRTFANNLLKIIDLAENGDISHLCRIMDENKAVMPQQFLDSRMRQAQAIDEVLCNPNFKMN